MLWLIRNTLLILVFLSGVEASTKKRLNLIADRSEISFYVPAKITNVRGYFREFYLKDIAFDEKKGFASLTGTLAIKTSSVFTRDRKRDEHLRAPDFFDSATTPEATVKVTAVKPLADDRFEVSIVLQIKDKMKTYQLPVKIQHDGDNAVRASGSLIVNRGDFALTGNHIANIIMKDDVEITFRLYLTR